MGWLTVLLLVCIAAQLCEASTDAAAVLRAKKAQSKAKRKDCKRLLWFTAIGESNSAGVTQNYQNLVKCAVLSAAEAAPSLIPHVIYGGQPCAFTDWFKQHGGVVHFWELTFLDKLQDSVKKGQHDQNWLKQWGAYLRLDIPLILKNYTLPPDAEQEYVLYTDADVMMINPVSACTIPRPKLIALGGEFTRHTMVNSGVLVINLAAYAKRRAELLTYGASHGWPGLFDQTLITEAFRGDLEQLPDGLNYKPYWGVGQYMRIIHFHGPKPGGCLDCLVRASGDGAAINKCGCPDIYKWIFTAMVPDRGAFYKKALAQYNVYRKAAQGGA